MGNDNCTRLGIFQSTLPREERHHLLIFRADLSRISIHAPTRGATTHTSISSSCGNYFNPRSHERSDRHTKLNLCINRYFNPRSHERSDALHPFQNRTCYISIHAPTRGATFISAIVITVSIISIHAPTRGATQTARIGLFISKFQSTLPREERRSIRSLISFGIDFNPRSHERSDSNIAQKICLFLYNTNNKYIIR